MFYAWCTVSRIIILHPIKLYTQSQTIHTYCYVCSWANNIHCMNYTMQLYSVTLIAVSIRLIFPNEGTKFTPGFLAALGRLQWLGRELGSYQHQSPMQRERQV